MARRLRGLKTVAAGLAVAIGLGLPASAARAADGYTPSPNEWWLSSWDVPQDVWPLSEGAGVTVGVVDTGVQASVADLRGVVVPGGDMFGDRGDGEVDNAGYQDGHGTIVAALIAGQGSGPGQDVGIAPKAKILPVHVAIPSGSTVTSAKGIEYAADHGASVINVSLDTGDSPTPTSCDPTMQDAVAHALARNIVVVAASGDTNVAGEAKPTEPASCPGVLTVGGIEPSGALWPDSTQQPNVSLAAPADRIQTVGMDGRSGTGSGTSYAAPLVAGAAALIRSRYPSMPWYQVDQRLTDTAIHVNGMKFPNNGYGYGIVNVGSAVDASKYPVAASAPNPVYTRYLGWLKSSDGQAWAKANGVTVPGPSAARTVSGTGSSATARPASSGSGTIVIIAVVVVVVIVAVVLGLVLRRRMTTT